MKNDVYMYIYKHTHIYEAVCSTPETNTIL